MIFANRLNATEHVPVSGELFPTRSHPTSGLQLVFIGPNGLRAGWRMLIFVALIVVLLAGFVLVRSGGLQGFRDAQKHAAQVTVTPLLLGGSEAIAFVLFVCGYFHHGEHRASQIQRIRAGTASSLEKRLLGRLPIGLAGDQRHAVCDVLTSRFSSHRTAMLYSLIGWGIAFLLVGLFEEFLNRGYLQYTLASGIGFWPAALVMSGLFALGHAFNPNETATGVGTVVLFGLLLCLFLRRTGNLWCAVGFHAA
jgi:uncharacterized protein